MSPREAYRLQHRHYRAWRRDYGLPMREQDRAHVAWMAAACVGLRTGTPTGGLGYGARQERQFPYGYRAAWRAQSCVRRRLPNRRAVLP